MDTAIAIEPKMYAQLVEEGRDEHRDAADIVNDLLRRHLLLRQMKKLRETIEPRAAELGYNTDEDVFRDMS